MSAGKAKPLLEMRNIHKSFGEIRAVDGIDITAGYGEVVGLIGDNGAGKSTLIKILAGIHKADKGEIYLKGKKVKIHSPRHAQMLGIETLFQDQALVDCMDVARNVFMGREPTRFLRFLKLKEMKEESMSILRSMGLSIGSVDMDVGLLSGGERQGVAIARALHFQANLLTMDEPTIALSVAGVERVLEYVKELREGGITVIFVTHNLYHVFPVADRFIIMKRGKVIHEARKEDTSIDQLSKLIISR